MWIPWDREHHKADLERHAREVAQRTGFAFPVLDPGGEVIGCVYLSPAPDVAVHAWVRASPAELCSRRRERGVGPRRDPPRAPALRPRPHYRKDYFDQPDAEVEHLEEGALLNDVHLHDNPASKKHTSGEQPSRCPSCPPQQANGRDRLWCGHHNEEEDPGETIADLEARGAPNVIVEHVLTAQHQAQRTGDRPDGGSCAENDCEGANEPHGETLPARVAPRYLGIPP